MRMRPNELRLARRCRRPPIAKQLVAARGKTSNALGSRELAQGIRLLGLNRAVRQQAGV